MTGLTLVCDLEDRPIRSGIIARLGERALGDGLVGQVFEPAPSIWIRNLARPVTSAPTGAVTSPQGHVQIVLHGEVYNSDELARVCGFTSPNSRDIADGPKLVATGIEKRGLSFVEQVNGSFTLIAWYPRERRLHVLNDRFGLRPHYLTMQSGMLLMAPTIGELLSCAETRPALNPIAIAELSAFEQLMGSKTLVETIEVLPPASVSEVRGSGLSTRRYWNYPFQEPPSAAAEASLCEELQHRLVKAVRRQLPADGSLGSLLSGGLDSRVLASITAREIDALPTFTYGAPASMDRVFSREVAEHIGAVQHVFSPEEIPSWAEHFRRAAGIFEGQVPALHAQVLMLLPVIQQKADVVLDGLAGDAIFGGWISPEMLTDEVPNDCATWLADRRYRGGFPRERLATVFPGKRFETVSDHVLDSMRAAIQRSGCASLANVSDYLMYTERVRRFTNLGNVLLRTGVEVRTPFFDYDLIDFALTLPLHLRYGQRLYRDAIRGLFPELRKVPFTPSGQRLVHSSRVRRVFFEDPRALAETVLPAFVAEPIKEHRRKAKQLTRIPSVDYSQVFRDELEHVCREYQDASHDKEEVFAPEVIESLISELSRGAPERVIKQLAIWLTLEMFRQQYGYDRV